MGGVKRKTMAAMEKSQESRDESTTPGQEKEKKGKEQKGAPPQQAKKLPFLMPKSGDQELIKSLTPLKAITVFTASKALGVNASIANEVLKTLENKKLLVRAGGFSGHYVWAIHQH